MSHDTIDYFSHQAHVMGAKSRAIDAAARADGSTARKQWMRAASDALQAGAAFAECGTRQLAQRWDGRMGVLSLNRA